jgi:hypothetical protein
MLTRLTTREGHRFWLHITALGIFAFGPIFALASVTATSEPARWTLDLLSWPLDGTPVWGAYEVRFLSALTGGFLSGFGALVFMLARRVHHLAPEPVRQAVMTGLLTWFVVDSSGSIASGTASNALWNVLVLVVLAGPLWRAARD